MKNGETIWRISKKYNVPVNEIIRYNNIEDVTDIPVGKKIYIPDDLENQKKYEDTNPNFIWPLQGVISRRFKIEGNIKHAGIDILSSEETPIVAAASGRVIYNGGQMAGYGNLIIIKHSNNLSTVYAHNKINLVNIGEQVTQGQTIAKVGNTGNTSRFHLHFEIRKNDKPIDPELLLPPL